MTTNYTYYVLTPIGGVVRVIWPFYSTTPPPNNDKVLEIDINTAKKSQDYILNYVKTVKGILMAIMSIITLTITLSAVAYTSNNAGIQIYYPGQQTVNKPLKITIDISVSHKADHFEVYVTGQIAI